MCTNLFKDSRLFKFIQKIDKDSEANSFAQPCVHCGGKLDRAFFQRKPRGVPGQFEEAFSVRPSFCCRTDGCRKRLTPMQLRFLSRKVYVSIIVLIAAAMAQGLAPKRLCDIQRELGVPPRTVQRWLVYWRKIFPSKSAWRYRRGNIVPPVDETGLPSTLLLRLSALHPTCHQAIITFLTIAIT